MTNKEKANIHRIAIIGAGFGGLRAALELERLCGRYEKCEIVLIDKAREHVYSPLLYEIATGEIQEERVECEGELRSGVCIRFEDYTTIIGSKHISFIRGEVENISFSKKQIKMIGKENLKYDDLIIAAGSQVETYGITGALTNALAFKRIGDSFRIRDQLHDLLDDVKRGDKECISIIIGGAGATGTEFASELANFFNRLCKNRVINKKSFDITLLDAGPNILAMLPNNLRLLAMKRLSSLGIRVMTSAKIKHIYKNGVSLELSSRNEKEGKSVRLDSDIVVWAGGIKPSRIIEKLDLQKNKKGNIAIDKYGRVSGHKDIYALGDCTDIVDPKRSISLPGTAWVATKQAELIAKNIISSKNGKQLNEFAFPKVWPACIPLGGKYAIFHYSWFHLSGYLGYVVRKTIDFLYFKSILPTHYAWHVWLRGAKIYMKND